MKSFYPILVKKYQKDDKDFSSEHNLPSPMEFFKIRYRNSETNCLLTICYCSDFQKQGIRDSYYILIDGTFDIAQEGFFQVLALMGQTNKMNSPLSYILLENKFQPTYEKAFMLFKTEAKQVGKSLFRAGTTFISDFERGLYNAIKKIMMGNGHYFQFCIFHYTQAVKRHFNNYPKTKMMSEFHQITNLLPFISEKRVIEVINELLDFEKTKPFAHYF